MRRVASVALLVALFSSPHLPASAQVMDLSTMSCAEFFEGPEDQISYVVMWLDGYYQDEEAPPVVDFDEMRKRMESLAVYCGQHPDHGLITAADETIWD